MNGTNYLGIENVSVLSTSSLRRFGIQKIHLEELYLSLSDKNVQLYTHSSVKLRKLSAESY